jgi:hypothetical protein
LAITTIYKKKTLIMYRVLLYIEECCRKENKREICIEEIIYYDTVGNSKDTNERKYTDKFCVEIKYTVWYIPVDITSSYDTMIRK